MSNVKKVVVRNKGHITIPKEIRDELNIRENSVLEVHIIGKAVVLTTQETSIPQLTRIINKELKEGNPSN